MSKIRAPCTIITGFYPEHTDFNNAFRLYSVDRFVLKNPKLKRDNLHYRKSSSSKIG